MYSTVNLILKENVKSHFFLEKFESNAYLINAFICIFYLHDTEQCLNLLKRKQSTCLAFSRLADSALSFSISWVAVWRIWLLVRLLFILPQAVVRLSSQSRVDSCFFLKKVKGSKHGAISTNKTRTVPLNHKEPNFLTPSPPPQMICSSPAMARTLFAFFLFALLKIFYLFPSTFLLSFLIHPFISHYCFFCSPFHSPHTKDNGCYFFYCPPPPPQLVKKEMVQFPTLCTEERATQFWRDNLQILSSSACYHNWHRTIKHANPSNKRGTQYKRQYRNVIQKGTELNFTGRGTSGSCDGKKKDQQDQLVGPQQVYLERILPAT